MNDSLNTPWRRSEKSCTREIRVAVLFQRFGPYHHARLNAAGKLMPVWGVEACAMETTYAWNKVEGAAAFTRVTLTERDAGDSRWKRELRKKMWRALDEIQPHVVVVNGWTAPEAISALAWCVKKKAPRVVMSESTAWDEHRASWKEWIKGRLVKMFAAGLAGGTPHADYLAQLGLPRERIFKGYDIVDNDHFASGAASTRSNEPETRSRLGLPEKYFLASARFVEKKNLSRLLEAYARYREMAKKTEIWKLVLIGDGPLRKILDSQLSTLDLRGHVLLPGFKQYDELPAYYGLAGAFVHASTTEQWGLVVNEAMASGLPVLVSNRCGCAADLVQEGVNGFTFDPCDAGQLADLMLKISASSFQLSAFGLESRRIISAWGPEHFANGLRDAVSNAMKHPSPRAGFLDRLLLRLLLLR